MLWYVFVNYRTLTVHLIFSLTDSPETLFNIQSSINNTFLLVITTDKCLKLSPTIELYLFAFDESIVNEVGVKEIDKLDNRKYNSFRINRQRRWFGPDEMHNFNIQSKFKFAIIFVYPTGVVDIALQNQLRTCM